MKSSMEQLSAQLRAAAEGQLENAPVVGAPAQAALTPALAHQLVHDLQVHQIELEMQNEALRQAKIALEESRDRYVDLYEFAPVAYLTLSGDGFISEINLTGSALFGLERKLLLRRRFAALIVDADQDPWRAHFAAVRDGARRGPLTLALRRGDGSLFHAQLDCTPAGSLPGGRREAERACGSSTPGVRPAGSALGVRCEASTLGVRCEASTLGVRGEASTLGVRGEASTPGVRREASTLGVRLVLTDISERKRAEAELLASETQLRQLSSHLQQMREEDRAHSARELHDDLGQSLTALRIDFDLLASALAADKPALVSRLASIDQVIVGTVDAVRRICEDLRPGMLDDLGLAAALSSHVKRFATQSGIACDLALEREDYELDESRSTAIFRIVQEALTNVARHARAAHVMVALQGGDGDDLLLTIADDGCGLSLEAAGGGQRYGLLGMRERVTMLGGTMSIDSEPGRGTHIEVSIPAAGGARR